MEISYAIPLALSEAECAAIITPVGRAKGFNSGRAKITMLDEGKGRIVCCAVLRKFYPAPFCLTHNWHNSRTP